MLYRDDFESSNIEAIAYEKEARNLYVMFKSTAAYRYEGVPASIVTAFLAAPSKGKYFSANIRSTYQAKHLKPEEIEQLMCLINADPLGKDGSWLLVALSIARQANTREVLF